MCVCVLGRRGGIAARLCFRSRFICVYHIGFMFVLTNSLVLALLYLYLCVATTSVCQQGSEIVKFAAGMAVHKKHLRASGSRKVVQVVTPGTALRQQMVAAVGSHNSKACCVKAGPYCVQ